MKYAGADWVQGRKINFSPLGAVVAEILGQVYSGIYHIDRAVLSGKAVWGVTEVSLPVYGSVSTYDFDYLTRLILCCYVAGVEVEVKGCSKYYIRFTFRKGRLGLNYFYDRKKEQYAENPLENPLFKTMIIKSCDKRQVIFTTKYSLTFEQLASIVVCAHQNRQRVELRGYGSTSLEVLINQRQAEGNFAERHRSFEEAFEELRPIYEPLFSEESIYVRQLHVA